MIKRNNNPVLQQCKAYYAKLKSDAVGEVCEHCLKTFLPSDKPIIEWDHREQEDKVGALSDIYFWTMNGGLEALQEEADKCRPLHMSCH
jgi:hypothetical protein